MSPSCLWEIDTLLTGTTDFELTDPGDLPKINPIKLLLILAEKENHLGLKYIHIYIYINIQVYNTDNYNSYTGYSLINVISLVTIATILNQAGEY